MMPFTLKISTKCHKNFTKILICFVILAFPGGDISRGSTPRTNLMFRKSDSNIVQIRLLRKMYLSRHLLTEMIIGKNLGAVFATFCCRFLGRISRLARLAVCFLASIQVRALPFHLSHHDAWAVQ